MGEDEIVDNGIFLVFLKIKKLFYFIFQLLKELFEFLKDQSLFRRRIRRFRRVFIVLRVVDFVLFIYFEEFYVENEFCNYIEQFENFFKKDKLKLVIKDFEFNERGNFDDNLKGRIVILRRLKRVVYKNIDYSIQKLQGKRERNGKGKFQ